MNMASYNPIDVNKYGLHTWNYLFSKAKKWDRPYKGFAITKRPASIDERKDPMTYSFKPNEKSKKILSESLRSFKDNNKASSHPLSQFQEEDSGNQLHQRNESSSLEQLAVNRSDLNHNRHGDDQPNPVELKEKREEDEFIDYDNDIRLEIALKKLGLSELIQVFNNFNITFNDLLFLEKEDLDEMQLHLYQKNRLLNFIEEYTQSSSHYTIGEIIQFFNNNAKYKALAKENKE